MRDSDTFREKRKLGLKTVAITAGVIVLILILCLVCIGDLSTFLAESGKNADVLVDTQIDHYSCYMGDEAKKEYVDKWGMKEEIFPDKISSSMNVLDYKMVFYDPWDAQYLSYLVAEYDDRAYAEETERLEKYKSTPYKGLFGAEGFAEGYTLLAMEADPDFGMIYALGTEKNQIIYVELIFCNYFMDLDYENRIDEKYLPTGFDATEDNPYRKQRLGEKSS